MPERSEDWFNQAQRDLESAKSQVSVGFYEWACFISQQAAEKAIKALYQKLAAEAWGHSANDLLRGLSEKIKISSDMFNSAKRLDRFYIPARYPNGWPEGFPGEYITKKDAEDAISDSEKIVRFCKSILVK